jgi:Holliday junction resolvasome RuvABC endonuclease subunit
MKTIIGIDNGTATGGLCAISAHDGAIIGYRDMPWVQVKSRKEVDLRVLDLWIETVTEMMEYNTLFVIEEPNNSRNASTAYSVGSCFHSLRGYFTARNLTFERITPQSWQKKMLGKVPKGETKKYAALAAVGRWPFEEFTKNARCKVLHPGIIDAALIAEYGRLTFTNKPLANHEEIG